MPINPLQRTLREGRPVSLQTQTSGASLPSARQIASDTTADAVDKLAVDASGGPVVITLPPPGQLTRVVVKKTDASTNAVRIQTPSGQPIDGHATPYDITAQNSRTVGASGTSYWFF